ncbi:EamA family transporter, partial [[Clostridium] innocuum]
RKYGRMNFMTKKVSNFNTMDLITYEEEHFMKKINWIQIIKIQAIIFLYSIISILSKIASSFLEKEIWMVMVILLIMLIVLASYAFLWQKLLKKVDLSIAYVNKGMLLFWSMIWSVVIFREEITILNIIGTIIIFVGIMVVNENA